MNPEESNTPVFVARVTAVLLAPRAVSRRESAQAISPPTKIADVEENGRYMPTAISIGDGELMRMSPSARNIPVMTSGHAISPPTMPSAINAISPAWGAGSSALPIS